MDLFNDGPLYVYTKHYVYFSSRIQNYGPLTNWNFWNADGFISPLSFVGQRLWTFTRWTFLHDIGIEI